MMRRLRVIGLLLVAAALSACTDPVGPILPTTEFITQYRAWLPGERAALVARIQRTRQLDFLFLTLSDAADYILPQDSVSEIVPNPYWTGTLAASFAPVYSVNGVRVPGAGWTTYGFDIHTVNAQQSNDTFDFLGVIWVNNADSTWKGMIVAASSGTTLPATTVNTTAFDAANDKSGAGGGEAKVTGGATTWLANGTGSPNQFSVSSETFFGSPATITTGPYLGGTQRVGFMNININNVGLTRALGSQAPLTQTASLSGSVTAVQYICLFPSPCTTNH